MAEVETPPLFILAPEDCATIFANPRHYLSASTQYSPITPTNAIPQRVSITVLAIEEEEALPIQERAAREAIQSSRVALPQMSSPSREVPRSSNLAHQSPAGKRSPCEERMHVDPSSVRTHSSSPRGARPTHVAAKILPINYEFCDVEDLVVLIADMISELIQMNDQLPLRDSGLTRFHSRTAPGISVVDYLQRLARHVTLTPPLLLSMVYYIDRLCSLYPAFTITSLTIHRFLITAATVAAKGLSDSYWNNATYARVGGIKVTELSMLELEFLDRVDWKVVPNPKVLVDYYRGLVERADGYVFDGEVEDLVIDQKSKLLSGYAIRIGRVSDEHGEL